LPPIAESAPSFPRTGTRAERSWACCMPPPGTPTPVCTPCRCKPILPDIPPIGHEVWLGNPQNADSHCIGLACCPPPKKNFALQSYCEAVLCFVAVLGRLKQNPVLGRSEGSVGAPEGVTEALPATTPRRGMTRLSAAVLWSASPPPDSSSPTAEPPIRPVPQRWSGQEPDRSVGKLDSPATQTMTQGNKHTPHPGACDRLAALIGDPDPAVRLAVAGPVRAATRQPDRHPAAALAPFPPPVRTYSLTDAQRPPPTCLLALSGPDGTSHAHLVPLGKGGGYSFILRHIDESVPSLVSFLLLEADPILHHVPGRRPSLHL